MDVARIDHESLTRVLAERLRRRNAGKLPSRFSPRLTYGRHNGPPACDARPAAVTVFPYPRDGCWHVPFTLRPQHLHDHGGQISLPGGRLEDDETFVEAACRELYEEVGVPARDLQILGNLSPTYVFASNFRVDPIVACVHDRPRFRADPFEVVEILEVPLRHLCDSANYGQHEIRRGGIRFSAPHIAFHAHHIWGATCMMVGELIEILREL